MDDPAHAPEPGTTLVNAAMMRRLISLSLDHVTPPSQVAGALAALSVEEVVSLIASEPESGWPQLDRVALLSLFAADPRTAVREQVAAQLGDLGERLPIALELLLQRLAADPAPSVRTRTAESLGRILQRTEGFTRTRVVGAWAIATDAAVRTAIAHALSLPFDAVGAQSAVELLARDETAEVRAAAAAAARARMQDAPLFCHGILRQLADDPDPEVRRASGVAATIPGEFTD